jgi:putative membrane protein
VTKILVGGISVLLADLLLSGVTVINWWAGFLLAAVIILINITIKPIMVLITLPVTLFTLGLFLLVINAFVVLLAAEIVPGFSVDGFWWALGFAICLSFINGVFGNRLNSDG